ncbi:DUF2125 domain-containing protein [Sulfitobacter albidus]|uniref:DUF2125 domain-containing protein n=1 Tax=Sulfitobacter albidus TaxID=2829501 RepID=A0A975PM87_9RHOB|nr:DUF2125 domain-containing protein [Sulfitobacter albidus]QUJ76459.1 DUF2125 domain-containing protein [Sulfitobacter albidus]
MTTHIVPLIGSAFGLGLIATSAAADLTAAEVWGDWQGYLSGMGYGVEATESTSGNTLTVSDITMNLAGGPDIETMQISIGSLSFVENGDGTVDVVMPDTMPITLEIEPKSTDEAANIVLTYSQAGQRMTASGSADALRYDYTADSFGFSVAGVVVDGVDMGEAMRVNLSGENLQSQTDVSVGETRSYDQTYSASNLVYDIAFKDPAGDDGGSVTMRAQTVGFEGTTALPVDAVASAADMNALMQAGFAFDGVFTTGNGETLIDITSADGTTRIKTGSVAGDYRIKMDADGLRYDLGATDMLIGAQIAGLPIPLSAQMASAGLELAAPVVKSDTPQDFALGFNLTEFSMSDVIWGLFDPSAQLPRDPATVVLDLSGKAKLLFDMLDPAAAAQLAPGTAPGEIDALKINTLTVDAVGARLDATGDVAFDNTDKTTLPGFPKPVGAVTVDLAGANGLIDKLMAMGLLPQEQAMGARMMMGLFAVPGQGEDTLTSTIEFNDAGQILANGQRLK